MFFPAFFLTPVVLAGTAAVALRLRRRASAGAFLAAGLLYLVGGLLLTLTVNVPMNEALAALEVPADRADAARIWDEYSPRWQRWNLVRTDASGGSLLLAVAGLVLAARPSPASSPASTA